MRGDEFFVRVASRPPFNAMHPKVAAFFKGYLEGEKVIPFGDRYVLNTHFPPFPSPAFDNLTEHFDEVGDVSSRKLYSVTLGVTNRCPFTCWHCYNAGRSEDDMPLDVLRRLAGELTERSAVKVALTGGEPLLRDDLEEIAAMFDERTCLVLGTTGDGLTPDRAESLREAGVFGVGRLVGRHVPDGNLPTPRETSDCICEEHLPVKHGVPRFFAVRTENLEDVGREDLRQAYDGVHEDYDAYWAVEARGPVEDLVARLDEAVAGRVFEAGCGTGVGTELLAARAGSVLAADVSAGMIGQARRRLETAVAKNVEFHHGDALAALSERGPFDLVFTSWVLGYIPLQPFFETTALALAPGGRLAFVVHRANSPARELGLFSEIVAEDPTALTKRVVFDFPAGRDRVREEAAHAGLEIEDVWEDAITFRYGSPREVLDHLLKSGAGTAFYEALDPARREPLTEAFLERLEARVAGDTYDVVHDYVGCIARRG